MSSILPVLLLLFAHSGWSIPLIANGGEGAEKGEANSQLSSIQSQLSHLQSQLAALETAQSEAEEGSEKEKRMPLIEMKKRMPLIEMKRMPVIEFKRDSDNGVFYDQPVLPAARHVPKRVSGWQPLKRNWQPLKRSGPAKFQLVLKDSEQLQQKLIDAVESHLVEDLRAAQNYGIAPEQILNDLQAKHSQGT